jgi:hypothetical protein
MSNIDHWHLALNFTPGMRGRIACWTELAELIASHERTTLSEKTVFELDALGDQAIAEEIHEATTWGSTETGNDFNLVDELKDACLAIIRMNIEGLASGRFDEKNKDAMRYPTPAQLGSPPAPGVISSPQRSVETPTWNAKHHRLQTQDPCGESYMRNQPDESDNTDQLWKICIWC